MDVYPVIQRSANYISIEIFSIRFGLQDVDISTFNGPPLIELVFKRATQAILIKGSRYIARVKHDLIIYL